MGLARHGHYKSWTSRPLGFRTGPAFGRLSTHGRRSTFRGRAIFRGLAIPYRGCRGSSPFRRRGPSPTTLA